MRSPSSKPAAAPPAPADVLDMPAQYFERTTEAEQARHREKLARLPAGGLFCDPYQDEQGGWNVEVVTMDWDEPGLLDRIFEAILRCIHIQEGVEVRQARIFTGHGGQVVNLLGLSTRTGLPLSRAGCDLVLEEVRHIQRGERGVLETIQHFPFNSLVPLVTDYPSLDNGRDEHYTYLELEVERLSNRFTSVLLHFLARSELWLNIQVAEFKQERAGHYAFYVVDKHGRKLKDSHFIRQSLMRALEAMNDMLMRFNLAYVQRDWSQRVERNERTVYHSRPDPDDFLQDLRGVRQAAQLKGFDSSLTSLVERGLLSSHSYYLLMKVEGFVERNGGHIRSMVESVPTAEHAELCRQYFEYRRRALRVLAPLFQRLMDLPSTRPSLSDSHRLFALCRPYDPGRFALDGRVQLYLPGSTWLGEPSAALDPLLLMARTDCYLREDTLEAIEAALESWTEEYLGDHRQEFGRKFLQLLDESVRQGNTATMLRTLRAVGLLQRFIPHFAHVQGLIHVVADHTYTVDEHTFVLIEVLVGMRRLGEVIPDPERFGMLADYQRLRDAIGLKNFANKYAMELRMLNTVTELRSNPSIRSFLQYMEEVRRNTLEYMVEVNLLEHGYTTCMIALNEIGKVRRQMDTLIRVMTALPFAQQRNMVLAGLYHDIKKPAVNHPELGGRIVPDLLHYMGIDLPEPQVARVRWLVEHHLDLRQLVGAVGEQGSRVVEDYVRKAGDPALLRELILFTYADRVAVHLDPNKNAHDAMILSELLRSVDALPQGGA